MTMLKRAVFDNTRVVEVSLTPLIKRTITMTIDSNASDANAIPAVIKKDFKILWSFDLYPITIPKKMIDKYIKNSTITRIMKSVSTKPTENLPLTTVDIKSFIVSKNVGEINIIKIEIITQAKPQSISIKVVKYFELMS